MKPTCTSPIKRNSLVTLALEYLDTLAGEAGSNSSLQRELATAYEKVGDIQGNPYYANLGDTDGALASYRKATSIRERLHKVGSTTENEMELERNLGLCYEKLGQVSERLGANHKRSAPERARDWVDARGWYRKGLDLFSGLRDRGTLMPADSEQPKKFAAKVRECDDAIARLKR
jgi:tetratricopeptide (TPR) repeat protein